MSLLILAASFLVAGCQRQDSSQTTQPEPAKLEEHTKFIVKLKSNTASVAGFPSLGDKGGMLVEKAGTNSKVQAIDEDYFTLDLTQESNRIEILKRLQESPEIDYLEPDPIAFAFHRPNDPQFSQQWAHVKIQSEQAWDLGQGSNNVIVGIIDSGIDVEHPDLKANVWVNSGEIPNNGRDDDNNGYVDDVNGYDFVNNDGNPLADDVANHGTHTAGTIGAVGDNSTGVVGHAPRVKLMALKFLGANGSGQVSDAIRAINYGIAMRVKILSNSWGSTQGSQALSDAIGRARAAGILFVAAAGNGGMDGVGDNNDTVPNYPSNYAFDNVIAVAATTQSDTLTRFSNFGTRTVHVGAPGENILSTKNGGQYQLMSGTSMATPLVSGVLALMIARRPDMTYAQIRQALFSNVDAVSGLQGRVSTNGRVNAFKAMSAISGVTPTPTPVPTATPVPTPTPLPTATPLPTPIPTPTPTPPPGQTIAKTPLIFGQTNVVVTNPNLQVPVDYDVSNFPTATAVYFEISKPNQGFVEPNGVNPDPNRLMGIQGRAPIGKFMVIPVQHLPGWGAYSMRILPLSNNQPVGRFSSPVVLFLRPQ